MITAQRERKAFRAAGDPTRFRILTLMAKRRQWTAKELGRELGVEQNRLYYHLRILEDAGLIEVVDTRAAGRMVERVFARTDEQTVRGSVSEPEERIMHLRAQLASATADAEEVIYEQARRAEQGERLPFVSYGSPGTYNATVEDFEDFQRKIATLVAEMHERSRERRARGEVPDNGWRELSFTYVLLEKELPDWFEPDDD